MNNKLAQYTAHTILFIGILVMILPIWLTFASSTHKNESIVTEGMKWSMGSYFYTNYNEVLNEKGGFSEQVTAKSMFINSFIMALGIASLKVVISSLCAFAIVYFLTVIVTKFEVPTCNIHCTFVNLPWWLDDFYVIYFN